MQDATVDFIEEHMRKLSNWIDAYLEYTEKTEPRKTFRRWAAIATVAACMQRKCCFHLGSEATFPNMYIVLVGPPASRKGTAMNPARDLLEMLGVPLAADESSRQRLVYKMLQSPSMTTRDDGSMLFHTSMTIFSSELTVFLKYENVELLGVLCDWYDCRSRFVYDTHTHGEQELINVWVNMFGATTPTLLQASLPKASIGSGFTSRTVFVYEDDKGKLVIYPELDMEIQPLLIEDLECIKSMQGEFKVEDGFLALYGEWRMIAEKSPPFRSPSLDYYLQRRQTHLLKLCMIYSAARSDNMVLRKADFNNALTTLTEAEQNMPRVFEGMGLNPLAEVQVRVIRELVSRKEMYIGELLDVFCQDVTSKQLAEILGMLQERRFCTIDSKTRLVKYVKKEDRKDE